MLKAFETRRAGLVAQRDAILAEIATGRAGAGPGWFKAKMAELHKAAYQIDEADRAERMTTQAGW